MKKAKMRLVNTTQITNDWDIRFEPDGQTLLKMPYHLYYNKQVAEINEKNKSLSKWADIQTKIIINMQQHYSNPHTYLRLHTYYVPKNLLSLVEKSQIEEIPTKEKKTNLYYIPDCHDKKVIKSFFEVGTGWHGGMTLFTLNFSPVDWKKNINQMHMIVEQLIKLQPISNFKDQLESCYLLCYSLEAIEYLVIAKSSLPNDVMLSIVQHVAQEEDLESKVKYA